MIPCLYIFLFLSADKGFSGLIVAPLIVKLLLKQYTRREGERKKKDSKRQETAKKKEKIKIKR